MADIDPTLTHSLDLTNSHTLSVRETMDYFRAVLLTQEYSPRTLALTASVIDLNAANYTAWHFRRQCLKALGSDLRAELEFVGSIAGDNPKNYQIWYHRRAVSELLDGSAPGELAYTEQVLQEDSKNYHAWSHRQWVISHFNCWDEELAFVDRMLTEDVRNNSAWNQRWFVVNKRAREDTGGNCGGSVAALDEARLRIELAYACEATAKAPNNQAPWSYIEGLMRGRSYDKFPEVLAHIRKLQLAASEAGQDCSPAMLACLVGVLEDSAEGLAEAVSLCKELETRLDVIRAKYWAFRRSEIERLSSCNASKN